MASSLLANWYNPSKVRRSGLSGMRLLLGMGVTGSGGERFHHGRA